MNLMTYAFPVFFSRVTITRLMESLFIRHYITEMHDTDIISQEKSGIINQDSCAEQKITFYYVEPERDLLPVNIRG